MSAVMQPTHKWPAPLLRPLEKSLLNRTLRTVEDAGRRYQLALRLQAKLRRASR